MPSLAFTGFMGWDNEHQRYVSLGASNLGEVARMEPQFPDDNTMIVARTGFMEGELFVERNILKIGDGTYSFEIEMAMGGGPFFTIGFTAWNPVDQCYDMISIDNMGMSGKAQLRDMGNGVFVGTASAMMYGQPTVTRTILTCDAQGIPVSVVADSIAGTGDVQRVFSGKYSRK